MAPKKKYKPKIGKEMQNLMRELSEPQRPSSEPETAPTVDPSRRRSLVTTTTHPEVNCDVCNAYMGKHDVFQDLLVLEVKDEAQFIARAVNAEQMKIHLEEIYPEHCGQKEAAKESYIAEIVNTEIPSDYQGYHLHWPLTTECVDGYFDFLYSTPGIPLHPRYVVEVLVAARDMLSPLPKVPNLFTNSEKHKNLVIVGDLHGQLDDLLYIIKKHGKPGPGATQYLFNGDFVDRGPHGVEIVILLLLTKLMYPHSVHLNRGNHEDISVQYEYGFVNEVKDKYGANNMMLLKVFEDIWTVLPILMIINQKYAVVHAGLSRYDAVTLDHYRVLPRFTECTLKPTSFDEGLLFDTMWSDPQQKEGRGPNPRGSDCICFGPDVTKAFLERNSLELLIRSHEVPSTSRGYDVTHDGKCVTIFSASDYGGCYGNKGGVMVFSSTGEYHFEEHTASDCKARSASEVFSESSENSTMRKLRDQNALGYTTRQIQMHVAESCEDLFWYWKIFDEEDNGTVPLRVWKLGMTNVLSLHLPWSKYAPLLVEAKDGSVNYVEFLNKYRITVDTKNSWPLEIKRRLRDTVLSSDFALHEMKSFFDLDGDGMLTAEELCKVLEERLQMGLTPDQVRCLMESMNHPGDQPITTIDFLEGLSVCRKTLDPDVHDVFRSVREMIRNQGSTFSETFQSINASNSGQLTYSEVAEFLTNLFTQQYGPDNPNIPSKALLLRVAIAVDFNNSGTIDYLEFADAFKSIAVGKCGGVQQVMQNVLNTLSKFRYSLAKTFEIMDVQGRGVLTRAEFGAGLKTLNTMMHNSLQLSDAEIQEISGFMDQKGSGEISWMDFLQSFTLQQQNNNTTVPAPINADRRAELPTSLGSPRARYRCPVCGHRSYESPFSQSGSSNQSMPLCTLRAQSEPSPSHSQDLSPNEEHLSASQVFESIQLQGPGALECEGHTHTTGQMPKAPLLNVNREESGNSNELGSGLTKQVYTQRLSMYLRRQISGVLLESPTRTAMSTPPQGTSRQCSQVSHDSNSIHPAEHVIFDTKRVDQQRATPPTPRTPPNAELSKGKAAWHADGDFGEMTESMIFTDPKGVSLNDSHFFRGPSPGSQLSLGVSPVSSQHSPPRSSEFHRSIRNRTPSPSLLTHPPPFDPSLAHPPIQSQPIAVPTELSPISCPSFTRDLTEVSENDGQTGQGSGGD